MKKATRIVSIFVISMLCFQELIHVSSSPFLYAHQVYEESSGGRNLKQEQEQEQKHAQEVHCSRERSRAARKVIEESHGKCLGDLCGALHCDAVMNFKSSRSKCNPAAAARNRHLCENLADNCFPISEGPSAGRLHELFLHQFCDAHTCSGKHKPFSRGGKDQSSFFRLAAGALILVLLPVFYLFLYLVQSCSDVKSRTQELRRISKAGWKSKPS
ncbi:hypothetical protein JHK82_035696 [Glycine max]|nr:hypothetical protein JHK85_036422 [Glycine max]KAG5112427.1 hypothetical protein JHK82_035696 [Glycine max]